MGLDAIILVFLIFSFKLALSLSSLTVIKRFFSSSLLSAIRMVSSAYLRLLIFLLPILIPACNTSSLAFLMMCSAHRSNKQGESSQPCHTPFSMLNQSVVPYMVLTVASWPVYRFLRRQVNGGIPTSLSESEVAQSCPTLWEPMDCSLPGSSVHGIFQARILEWVAIFFSRGSSWPRDRTRVSCIVGRRFTIWATREVCL